MTSERRATITRFLRACPTEAVRDVAERPDRGWGHGYYSNHGRRCLVGIAANYCEYEPRRLDVARLEEESGNAASDAFEACCSIDGLRATVAACREIACGILADRAAKA